MSDKTRLVVHDNDGEHLWVTWGDTEIVVSVATGQLQGFIGSGVGSDLIVTRPAGQFGDGMVTFFVTKPRSEPVAESETQV